MSKRVAVMDLGTNTFHLLITEGPLDNLTELQHDHEAVKLGEGGINKGYIVPEAFERGLNTMRMFKSHINRFAVTEVKAIATSALRSAANGKDFIDQVKVQTGISIEVIAGDTEAAYIYEGVKASGCLNDSYSLIVDIGGGSVEFILASQQHIRWKQSFEIGAARLMDKFHRTDPIPAESVQTMHTYLDEFLAPMFAAVKDQEIENIIGSSGAFETFVEIAERDLGHDFDFKSIKNYTFNTPQLIAITDQLISSTHAGRSANPSIIPVRVDMIVVASLLTRYLMQKLNIDHVCMSAYSLKEGVLASMIG